jgi:hypothetical protein
MDFFIVTAVNISNFSPVGSVVNKAALGQVFSGHFCFPSQLFMPPLAPRLPLSTIQGWYNKTISDVSNNEFVSATVQ